MEPARGWVISRHPAHAALVSEAGFITVQQIEVPRGPTGPAVRRYLFAGLIACGRCGRRLESCWFYGRPAYRCRHGYTSATRPEPGRPPNTNVREDQILPHLAAIAILLAGPARKPDWTNRGLAQLPGPDSTAALIDQLRSGGTVLTYDPQDRTLRVGDPRHAVRHYRQEALTLTHARTSERRTVQGRRKTREHPLRPEAERG